MKLAPLLCRWFAMHLLVIPTGIECIEVTEHFSFCRGNAIKYLWRAGAKGNLVEDLRKAVWYIEREIANIEAERSVKPAAETPAFFGGGTLGWPDEGPKEAGTVVQNKPYIHVQPPLTDKYGPPGPHGKERDMKPGFGQ